MLFIVTRPPGPVRSVGPALVGLGVGAVVLATAALDWYDRTNFADLRSTADGLTQSWLATAYFDWLVWVLVVVLVLLAVVGGGIGRRV